MLESLRWGEWVGGGPHDFSINPSSLWTNWVFELGWGWAYGVLGLRDWGQALTNKFMLTHFCSERCDLYDFNFYVGGNDKRIVLLLSLNTLN